MHPKTVLSYRNFVALTKDILELANEIMPDHATYINFLNQNIQVTLRVSEHDTNVQVKEGHIIPVENAICNTLDYQTGTPLVTADITTLDFNDKVKQTIKDSNIKAYLGIPISYQNGERFGTLCATHDEARTFNPKDVILLQNIAKLFSYYLELEHIAYKDALTGLFNSHFLHINRSEILNDGGSLILLDLDYFKSVNDQFGHDVGDLVLREVGAKLTKVCLQFKEAYAIRLGGDEFLIYLKDQLTGPEMTNIIVELLTLLRNWETPIGDLSLSTSVGAFSFVNGDFPDFDNLLKNADKLLYKAKHKGRNNFVFEVK